MGLEVIVEATCDKAAISQKYVSGKSQLFAYHVPSAICIAVAKQFEELFGWPKKTYRGEVKSFDIRKKSST